MKRRRNLRPSPEDIHQLDLVRLRLKRRLKKITNHLHDSTFADGAEDINFVLIEQQIVSSRLERMDDLLRLARLSAHDRTQRKH